VDLAERRPKDDPILEPADGWCLGLVAEAAWLGEDDESHVAAVVVAQVDVSVLVGDGQQGILRLGAPVDSVSFGLPW